MSEDDLSPESAAEVAQFLFASSQRIAGRTQAWEELIEEDQRFLIMTVEDTFYLDENMGLRLRLFPELRR
jgi:hypothetical protein